MPLNSVEYAWDLDVEACPCDVDLNAWVAEQGIRDQVLYHFGTGSHHVVGREQATNGSGNVVLGVTASLPEHQSYVDLILQDTHVAKRYAVLFGDAYLTDLRLLPALDVVSLFHLGEFSYWNTVTQEYGGMTDRQLLDGLTAQLRTGGHVLLYPGSAAWASAQEVVADWEREKPVERLGRFRSLLVYRKGALPT